MKPNKKKSKLKKSIIIIITKIINNKKNKKKINNNKKKQKVHSHNNKHNNKINLLPLNKVIQMFKEIVEIIIINRNKSAFKFKGSVWNRDQMEIYK